MSLRNNIDEDYKKAIKNKEQDKINALRLIRSAIKDKDIEARTSGIDDGIKEAQIMTLLQSLIKQRNDSIDSFKKANRNDLIEKEKEEIEIIKSFLPLQKNEKETEEIIDTIIKTNNINSLKDMGKLMGFLKSDYSGQIDMGLAGKIAKSKLSS